MNSQGENLSQSDKLFIYTGISQGDSTIWWEKAESSVRHHESREKLLISTHTATDCRNFKRINRNFGSTNVTFKGLDPSRNFPQIHEFFFSIAWNFRQVQRERERERMLRSPCLTHNIIIPHKGMNSNDKEKYGETKGKKKNELTAWAARHALYFDCRIFPFDCRRRRCCKQS